MHKVQRRASELVVLPDGLQTVSYSMAGIMTHSDGDETINKTVSVAFDGNTVYVQGLSYWFEEAWAKGTIQGDKVVFPSNQLMGEDNYGPDYLVAYVLDASAEKGYSYKANLEFDYEADSGVMTLNEDNFYGETDEESSTGIFNYCMYLKLSPGEAVGYEEVELPEGLVPVQYTLKAQSMDSSEEEEEEYVYTPVNYVAQVALDGNDAYIQGLCSYLPEAWVKGSVSGNKIVVPTGQYFGTYDLMFEEYNMFFVGYSEGNGLADVTFTMSDDGNTLTADNWVFVNSSASSVSPYEILTSVVLTKTVEKAAMPASPSVYDFSDYDQVYKEAELGLLIPNVDVDGEPLIFNKLTYRVYVDESGAVSPYTFKAERYDCFDKDMVEIPYTFSDNEYFFKKSDERLIFLQDETSTYTRIGVQSIYRGGNVENATEIAWFTIERDADAISAIKATPATDDAIYTMEGQRVSRATKGVYIQNGKKFIVK